MDKNMTNRNATKIVAGALFLALVAVLIAWSEFSVASPWYHRIRSARAAAHHRALEAQAAGGPFPGLIFSSTASERLHKDGGSFILTSPFWTPAVGDVVELERVFTNFVASDRAAGCERLLRRQLQHKRQYFGFTSGGKRLIYVNGLCDPDGTPYWMTDFVSVTDGGDCYFQATYDPVARAFTECHVNGFA